MQKPTAKKPALHGAAAKSDRRTESAKDHAKSATAKPADTGRKPAKGNEADSHTRTR